MTLLISIPPWLFLMMFLLTQVIQCSPSPSTLICEQLFPNLTNVLPFFLTSLLGSIHVLSDLAGYPASLSESYFQSHLQFVSLGEN